MSDKKAAPAVPQGNDLRIAVSLTPIDHSDQPVYANYVAFNAAQGVVMVDFGFLEPAALNAVTRTMRNGGKAPPTLNGKLASRVALGPETLRSLYEQLAPIYAKEGTTKS